MRPARRQDADAGRRRDPLRCRPPPAAATAGPDSRGTVGAFEGSGWAGVAVGAGTGGARLETLSSVSIGLEITDRWPRLRLLRRAANLHLQDLGGSLAAL